jgi:type II secretory pathway component PulF
MNYDEFAFFNQQLAAMLREGIPLEGSLKQLSAGMRSGPLRSEIQQLEADLARGTPLGDALGHRKLPVLYRRMVEVGVRSNDLPGVLILLADHYHRAHALGTRLKGLMVYPLIVLVVSTALSLLLSVLMTRFLRGFSDQLAPPTGLMLGLWVPPFATAALVLVGLAAVLFPGWRRRLRWWLPAFREASLAQLSSALALMLRNGTTLAEALALAEALESDSPARAALAQWRARVESGQGKPAQWPNPTRPFPPLFLWLIQKGGEDAAAGFQQAADVYQARAGYRADLALYGALPVSVLFMGQMIVWQLLPFIHGLTSILNMLGGSGGGGPGE